jgi:hypothetical protein
VFRLEQVFEAIGQKVRGKHCDGIAGIIEEGKSIMEEDFDDSTMDACLIAAGQRAEHYEMAAYGTLVAWAKVLGHDDAADLLEQTLEESGRPDRVSVGVSPSAQTPGRAYRMLYEKDHSTHTGVFNGYDYVAYHRPCGAGARRRRILLQRAPSLTRSSLRWVSLAARHSRESC